VCIPYLARAAVVTSLLWLGANDRTFADETLSITLVSIGGWYQREYPYNNPAKYEKCLTLAAINNDTDSRINDVSASISIDGDVVWNIALKNIRARSTYRSARHAWMKCGAFVSHISEHPDFARITECNMEGLREGQCLRMTKITSTLTMGQAKEIETYCRPLYSLQERQDACSDNCEKQFPNKGWDERWRPCVASCEQRYPSKPEAKCQIYGKDIPSSRQ
jgi:hypothetical protein